VPFHPKLPPAEARYILEDSQCRQAVVHPGLRTPALDSELKALGVEIVELPPSSAGVAAAAAAGGGAGAGGQEVVFVESGPVKESTDAMVIYTRYGCVGIGGCCVVPFRFVS